MGSPIRRLKAVEVTKTEVIKAQVSHQVSLRRQLWAMRVRHLGGRIKWPLVRLWGRIKAKFKRN